MRLRDKKTGKIYTLSDDLYIEYTQGGRIEVRAIIPGGNMSYYYESLDKLNEDWEDAKEPLIKDEKVRKAVRAWAESVELNPKDRIIYVAGKSGLEEPNGAVIYFEKTILDLSKIEDGRHYSIEELCGSEEIEILEPVFTTIEEKEKLKGEA